MAGYETIVFDVDGPLATLTMNRPGKLNAMNTRMGAEFLDVCRRCEEEGVRCLVVTGDLRAFSSGADLAELASGEVEENTWGAAINTLAELPLPTIAAIEGWCLAGGLLLAACCDLRVASSAARLGAPEVRRGLIFGSTGAWRMSRLVGVARAKELLYLGDEVDAVIAERWGLVNRVVAPGRARQVAIEMAQRLATGATLALGAMKRLIDDAAHQDLTEGTAEEERLARPVATSQDILEGVRAFGERRRPEFKGR